MSAMDLDDEPEGLEEHPSLALHRVRFVDWSPSAITSIAFLPVPANSSSSSRGLMAVGFENGNINLCTWVQDDNLPSSSTRPKISTPVLPKGWLVDTTLIGAIPSKIDTLAFALCSSNESIYRQPRLFSTSGGSIVTEHFIPPHLLHQLQSNNGIYSSSVSSTSTSKNANSLTGTSRTISSQGGSVWCMSPSPTGRYLAIGCEVGHVRIVDIQDNRFELLAMSRSARRAGDGTIEGISNTLDRAKTRIVSLAWGPPKKRTKKRRAALPGARPGVIASDPESSEDEDTDEWEESFILGGTTHSSALVWTLSTGRIESKLLVDKSRNEQTIVWSASVLKDGTLILGDSLGHVTFFDGKNRTILPGCRFTNHGKGADVLTICVGSNGKTVYSAGLDQKVIEYALVGQGNQQKWICTGARRLHAHDIRSLAIEPPFDMDPTVKSSDQIDRVPVLVSGGSDFNLVLTPASPPSHLSRLEATSPGKKDKAKSLVRKQAIAQYDQINPISTSPFTTFADTIQRRIPFVPQSGRGGSLGGGSVVRVCAAKRWLLLRREKSVAIWQLPEHQVNAIESNGDEVNQSAWTKLVEMQIKLKTNLVCAELSGDGKYLAVGDLCETKLYRLESSRSDVIPHKVKSFSQAFKERGLQRCPGSSAIVFTPEGSRIILASHPGSFIHVVELPKSVEKDTTCKLIKTFDDHRKRVSGRAMAGRSQAASVKLTNGHTSNGTNGHTANGNDRSSSESDSEKEAEEDEEETESERTAFSRIDIMHTSPDGQYLVSIDTSKRINVYSLDSLHYYRTLPSTSQVPTSISFNRFDPSRLCLLLPTNQMIIYNLEERNNQEQGRRDHALETAVMEKIVTIRESAIGAIWLSSKQMLVWGSTWICSARLAQAASPASVTTKRGRMEATPDASSLGSIWSTTLTFKYQPLLHVGLVSEMNLSAKQEDELVVVERPYYDLARSLPPTWFSGASYGT